MLGRRFFLGNLLTVAAALLFPSRSRAACQLNVVHRSGPRAGIRPASFHAAGRTTLEWIAHACFVITTDRGTRIVTDPVLRLEGSPLPAAEVATAGCLHPFHNAVGAVPGNPKVFFGISSNGQQWNRINAVVKEIKITSVPTFHLDGQQKGAGFVFQFGGLCVVHLGDLGQPLSAEARSILGRPDVLLLPIGGGTYSIDPNLARTILDQLQPRLAIPMHTGEPEEEVISRFIAGFPRVQRLEQTALFLTPLSLPAQTTIAVLKHL